MSSHFFGISDRFYTYSHTIGRTELAGTGFRIPVDLALGENELLYVVNRTSGARQMGVRITVCTLYEEYINQFGSYGDADGDFIWPTAIALDANQNIYVSDEWLNRISVFDKDGQFLNKWGSGGSREGELNRPSGLVVSNDGVVLVADAWNHRIQKFTSDGRFLGQFGRFGNGTGQLNMPWGLALDSSGVLYVADWRNDRVQCFSQDGAPLSIFGRSGSGPGEFNRPTDIAVDQDGDIYVTDWLNDRVQVLTPDGRYITEFKGNANLSKWGKDKLISNPDMIQQRNMVTDFSPEYSFWQPSAVETDSMGRVVIADSAKNRVQVYQKNKTPVLV